VTSTSPGWTFLVPVKDTARGKSRIDLPAELRRRLALAMALDTVTAAARCGSVMAIVESEADALALAAVPGVMSHRTGVTGLNESIRDGVKALSGSGLATDRVAVLPGDLPGLRHQELSVVLHECAAHRFSVVADHQGVGTTLLAATEPGALEPQYGPDSCRRHQLGGAVLVDLPNRSSLRWDIDTVADLDARLGPASRAALAGSPRRHGG
jgi:2-phospho-L-lactate guanylyltransferase